MPGRKDSLSQKETKKKGKKDQDKVAQKKIAKDVCLVCKKKADLSKDGVACNVCGHQFHIHCKDIPEDFYDILQDIAEKGWENPYRCESCKSAIGALEDKINKNTAELARVAEKVEANDERLNNQDDRVTALEEAMNELNKKQSKKEQQSSVATSRMIQDELAQQKARSTNLVFHGISECETEAEDQAKVQEIIDYLNVTADIKWVRRLSSWRKGKKSSKISKPLLVSLVRSGARDAILEVAFKLSKSSNPNWKTVRIVPDLTPSQRDAEENLRKECTQKNLARTEEEVEKNLIYKVVGPKGAVQLKRFELRENEVLHKGRVLPREVVNKILEKDNNEEDMEVEAPPPPPVVHSTPKRNPRKDLLNTSIQTVKDKVRMFNARRPSFSGALPGRAVDLAVAGPSGDGGKRKLGDLQYSPNGSPPLKEKHVDNTETESENENPPLSQGGKETPIEGSK